MSRQSSPKAHSSKANAQRAARRAHRATIAQRNRTSLSLFRSLTHQPNLRAFHDSRILRQREATKGVVVSPYFGFLKLANELENLQQRTCRARKERRQVLFAHGKSGGNHKPPRYTELSKIRC